MRFNRLVRTACALLFIASISETAFAQKYEVYPYAGGFWPAKIDDFKIQNQGMWGVRGGYFLSDRVQLEGNFGYLNHFGFENDNVSNVVNLTGITVVTIRPDSQIVVTDLDANSVAFVESNPKQRGYLWEANFSYHFFESLGSRFAPYLTVGVGGTTVTRSGETVEAVVINQPNLTTDEFIALNEVVNRRVDEARAFLPTPFNTGNYFTFNYGGGVKGYRLWGPVGLRVDFLGRSLPNFGGDSLNAFQLTGGVTFAWGER